MADSYLVGGAKLGMDVRIASPRELWPRVVVRRSRALDRGRDRRARSRSPRTSRRRVRGCDAVATDVWLSMGEPEEAWAERIRLLLPYQVNAGVLAAHRQPRREVPALPARLPQRRTRRSARSSSRQFGLDALEVTDEVFESPASVVFDEAENRMHTIKAVLVATLGG